MSRPLIICDCDEVLLHMIVPFKQWLEEGEGVRFEMVGNNFGNAMRWESSAELLEPKEVWHFLGRFFDTQMDRQMPIAGAVAGINRLAEAADVVILTNLADERRDNRARQLADHGITSRVFTNQGPKGPAIRSIIEEYAPSHSLFIDDLPQHHESAAQAAPLTSRLHMCGEPMLAPHIECAHEAGHAHARIDQWSEALPWLLEELENGPR
ncbi:MAG: hypothetical protein APF82_00490 [Sphingomonadales bacterium BRH_c42]|nr:MAG: hypothetical protein APF82_00490 [Sphingomonadales bacterium BRH_c42]